MTEKIKTKTTTKQTALEIYVGEDKMSLAQSVNAQVLLLSLPTPEKYIMQRQGSCLLYTSPSPRDRQRSRMPSSA